MSTRTYKIIDGPPAEMIWDHVKYAMTQDVKILIRFTTDRWLGNGGRIEYTTQFTITPSITTIGHSDTGDRSLYIQGSIGGNSFKGYYNPQSRQGRIDVETV